MKPSLRSKSDWIAIQHDHSNVWETTIKEISCLIFSKMVLQYLNLAPPVGSYHWKNKLRFYWNSNLSLHKYSHPYFKNFLIAAKLVETEESSNGL